MWTPLVLCLVGWGGDPGDLEEGRRLLETGRYYECLELAAKAVAADPSEEPWHLLRIRAQLRLGELERARASTEVALEEFSRSLELRLLAHEVFLRSGDPDRAESEAYEVERIARRSYRRYLDPESLVIRGRSLILLGEDPKAVLDAYYARAKREAPDEVAAYRAIAELALEKHDYGLAAEELGTALELAPEDPDLLYLWARAYAPTDPPRAAQALGQVLTRNPHHAEALLLAADRDLAAELDEPAEAKLARLLEVDPSRWEPWAYRAVLAHLRGDRERERACRDQALAGWPENPAVDHLIGRELSEKYRFAVGARAQRRALELDPGFEPARFQLAQDLLRLGEGDEGWRLAEEVAESDEYNVVAYNLMVLQDVLRGYRTLERDGLVLRMEPREAEVYGARLLDLLEEARRELGKRYRVRLDDPIVVEVFAEQKDFAIRTFGLPGGAGFLAVCFGDVVTVQSPDAPGKAPSSWEATVWHELCHTATLKKTRNRMPRWLSEGISVYEERRRDPSWGRSMNPAFRERILSGGAVPVSRLSSAFLSPPDDWPLWLSFAYFQSSLVVEYLVEEHGFEALLAVLDDLGQGLSTPRALTRRIAPLDELDAAFAAHLRGLAEAYAPEASWEPFRADPTDLDPMMAWIEAHPSNLGGLLRVSDALVEAGRAEEALPLLERARALAPGLVGDEGAYPRLARVHRERGDVAGEREVIAAWAARDADSLAAHLRWIELLQTPHAPDAPERLFGAAQRALAIQPMSVAAHEAALTAGERLQRPEVVLRSGHALLALDPVDPARLHYRLALAARELGQEAEARRQVVRALEEAPRYRAAHALLLELERSGEAR